MDRQYPSPRRRLPGQEGPGLDEARAVGRDRGLRQVRRLSNWTAAALIALTSVTAGYFAHAAARAPRPATTAGAQSPAPGSHQPCLTAPVATSGGSGVAPAAPMPSSCGAGQNGTRPPVVYVDSHERGDQ